VKDENLVLFKQEDILVFDVRDSVETRGGYHGRWTGVLRPILEWTTECLSEMEVQS
jgi:hypothetical protein